MRLLIDIGNTSAKIAVADKDIVHVERLTGTWGEAISRLTTSYDITSARISTVVNDNKELHDFIGQLHIPSLWLSSTLPYPSEPLKNIPKGFGADRWAADAGAMSLAPNHTILVIDAGTCITYDVISSDGRFLGGAISPGVQLRLTAMHEHTARLPMIKSTAHKAEMLGHDTQTSMLSSATYGTRFEIEGYIRRLLKTYPDLHVFITGGDEFDLTNDIACPIKYVPHLVFIGLNALTTTEKRKN